MKVKKAPEPAPLPEQNPLKVLKATSFHELQVSHVRLIIQELDHKVYELSTISQQIPQLQTFKRTLDLTMPEHNSYLTKIVDVLIELHHKINKLISRRPEKLLQQIEQVQRECLLIENAATQFFSVLETSQNNTRLKPIYFDQRKNNSPDHFRKIQKSTVKFSEIIINCVDLEEQAEQKISHIKSLIEVFWNLISGMQEYEKQWKNYKNKQNKSHEQQQIIEMLDLCLNCVNDQMQRMNQEFQQQRAALIQQNQRNQDDLKVYEQKEDEFRHTIIIKDDKISQLNQQILGLNAKLSDMVNSYKNMEFQLKRRQRNQQYLNNRVREYQLKSKQNETVKSADYQQLFRNYELSQKQLNNALLEIEKCKKKIVPDLQAEIKRRETIISEMQRIINSLQQKQNGMLNQQQNYLNLRKFADELEDEIRNRDNKIRELQSLIHQGKIKIVQLQGQIRSGGEDSLRRIKELEQKMFDYDQNVRKIKQLESKLGLFNSNVRKIEELESIRAQNLRDLQRLHQLQNTLRIHEQNSKKVPELESKAQQNQFNLRRISQLQAKNRQLQAKIRQNDQNLRKITDLQNRLQYQQQNGKKSLDLQAKLREYEQNIRNLQFKIKQQQQNARKIPDLQSKARQNDNNVRKISDLQNRLLNSDRQLAKLRQLQRKIQTTDSQNLRSREAYQKKIRDLQFEINQLKLRTQSTQDSDLQLRNAQNQIARLKSFEQSQHENNNKIANLDATLRFKTSKIAELQAKIRSLQLQLSNQQRQIQKSKGLMDNLRQKQRQISLLIQQKSQYQSSRISDSRAKEYQKQIQYLKQKIRSLQDLIDIFTEQHGILEAKIKQYRLRQSSNKQGGEKYEKLLQEYNSLLQRIKIKDQQFVNLQRQLQQHANSANNSNINPDFVMQLIYRIISHITRANPETPEGRAILDELTRIRMETVGEQFFVILEEFTKYIIGDESLDDLRKQLALRLEEIQILKSKLDAFFNEQANNAKRTIQRTQKSKLTTQKVQSFRQRFVSTTTVSHTSIIR